MKIISPSFEILTPLDGQAISVLWLERKAAP